MGRQTIYFTVLANAQPAVPRTGKLSRRREPPVIMAKRLSRRGGPQRPPAPRPRVYSWTCSAHSPGGSLRGASRR